MKEIEVKILEINKKEIIKKLKENGAKFVGEQTTTMTFFDSKDNYLKKHRHAIRIRNEGKKDVMTFKEFIPNKKVKMRNEYNLRISDLKTAQNIIELLGFHVSMKIRKKKIVYSKGKTKFEINVYLGKHKHIPAFLEIEAPDEKILFKHIKKLGISENKALPWSTFDVISHYGK